MTRMLIPRLRFRMLRLMLKGCTWKKESTRARKRTHTMLT